MTPPGVTLAVLTLLHALVACWAVRSLWPRARSRRLSAGLWRALLLWRRCGTTAAGDAAAVKRMLRRQ